MGKVTNPFAPVKKAGSEVVSETQELDRPEYVEPDTQSYKDQPGYHGLDATRYQEVPNGTAKEVLEWVGNDKDRAQRALDVEAGKSDGGRKGLTRELNEKLEN